MTTFTPEIGVTYANRISGKRFVYNGLSEGKHLWMPEGGKYAAPMQPDNFEVAPVLKDYMPEWEDLAHFPEDKLSTPEGGTVTILNAFANDWYQCEFALTSGRKEIKLVSLDQLHKFMQDTPPAPALEASTLSPLDMAALESAERHISDIVAEVPAPQPSPVPAPEAELVPLNPPFDVTALPEDAPGPYPESAERVAEIEAILKEKGILYTRVQQVNHTAFMVKLPHMAPQSAVHDMTYKCHFTPYKKDGGKVYVHPVARDKVEQYATPGGLSEATDQYITELATKVAGKDQQIERLTKEIASLKTMLENSRQVVINGGVQGNKKKAFIRTNVSEAEYDTLINTPRTTITAVQFVANPATGEPQFCVSGYTSVYDPQPAARIEAHRPIGGMVSIADALPGMMDAAARLGAEVHTGNGGKIA